MITNDTLQYSCCNEDTQSELDALSVQGRRVLSIAAAGGRAISLLLGNPKQVIAVDRNPAQVHLGNLKVAAIRQLEREEYLAFAGIHESSDRLATYQALRSDLPEETRQYWDNRHEKIETGILHVGRCERSIARIAPLLRFFLRKDLKKLKASTTLAEQTIAANKMLGRWSVRALFALVFSPLSGKYILRDPVYYGEVRRNAGSYLRERLISSFENHFVEDCFVVNLFLHGNLKNSTSLPIHLTEENYPIVRSRLDNIQFKTTCIMDYLANQPDESIDAFSLSDLGGYLTTDEFSMLLDSVQRVGSQGASLCIREYISEPTQKATWPQQLSRNLDIEERLLSQDRSVGCTFVCASKSAEAHP